ncbi:MAG TPA: hypothetical protein VF113_05565 [Stellaceae bacterium]
MDRAKPRDHSLPEVAAQACRLTEEAYRLAAQTRRVVEEIDWLAVEVRARAVAAQRLVTGGRPEAYDAVPKRPADAAPSARSAPRQSP